MTIAIGHLLLQLQTICMSSLEKRLFKFGLLFFIAIEVYEFFIY